MKATVTILLTLLTAHLHAQLFNWTQQNSGVAINLTDVHFYSNSHGWVCGVNGTILRTTDGGLNWQTAQSNTTEPLNCIFFSSATTGWVAGGTNSALLLHTTDIGQTWATIGSGINSGPILDLAFLPSGDTGWAITADSIYFTANGGANWVAEDYSGVTGTAVNKAIALINSSAVFVGGRRFQTGIQDSSPEVYNRKKSGNSFVWSPTTVNQFANMDRIESIAFTDDLIGIAGGIQGKLYRMNPSPPIITGPWNVNLDLGGGNNQSISGIDFANSYKGMFGTPHQMGANSYTLIYHTQDTGASWPFTDSINNFNMNSLTYPDVDYAWAVGNNGKIYKGTGPSIGQQEHTIQPQIKLFPNPTCNILHIQANDLNQFNLQIHDITGRTILINSYSNTSEVSLNTTDLSPGIYFLLIDDGCRKQIVHQFIKK